MKSTILAIIIVLSALIAPAAEAMPAPYADTVFILLKNDSLRNNEINEGIYARGYTVYGFVRNGKPRDFIDSLGYFKISISLSKDTLAVYDEAVYAKRFAKKTISLYDLRDSLKANMDLGYYRKHRLAIIYRPEDRTFVDASRHMLVLVIPKKNVCYLRRIEYINYFYRQSD
ncbi:hypothetical protein [Niastella sp. OAS944]|uniref:hypothetical protein n=1 Tax=Niastella sp. OAS944 TaxID=2664089 RepID=UPI0035C7B6B4|nr:hypothetical protein [Chitinophagaceae bacterium OAS944]